MITIGEKLNSSITKTLEAFNAHDESAVVGLIKLQEEHGAQYLDINTAMTGKNEAEMMKWGVGLVRRHSSCGVMIDSADISVILPALEYASGTDIIVNSVTATQRLHELAPAIAEKNASVVCLPIDDSGTPKDTDAVLSIAADAVSKLKGYGIAEDKIYVDTLVHALSVDTDSALFTLANIRRIKSALPGVKTLCGLSNISFGLPGRALLNSTFLSVAMYCGLDSAILDVTSEKISEALRASAALLGKDEFCLDYIEYLRSK
jgi:cobalamin-dependent methionine synthase I